MTKKSKVATTQKSKKKNTENKVIKTDWGKFSDEERQKEYKKRGLGDDIIKGIENELYNKERIKLCKDNSKIAELTKVFGANFEEEKNGVRFDPDIIDRSNMEVDDTDDFYKELICEEKSVSIGDNYADYTLQGVYTADGYEVYQVMPRNEREYHTDEHLFYMEDMAIEFIQDLIVEGCINIGFDCDTQEDLIDWEDIANQCDLVPDYTNLHDFLEDFNGKEQTIKQLMEHFILECDEIVENLETPKLVEFKEVLKSSGADLIEYIDDSFYDEHYEMGDASIPTFAKKVIDTHREKVVEWIIYHNWEEMNECWEEMIKKLQKGVKIYELADVELK